MIQEKLAIDGGEPVRTEPLPLEFPGAHYLGTEEIEAATRVLSRRSPYRYFGLDLQREVAQFEGEFRAFLDVPYAVAVTSGTGALHTALAALGVAPGQEIIIPAYLWVAIASAVVNLGAIPVIADIDETFCIDPKGLEQYITPRTRGIVAVHMSGAPCDIESIIAVARKHGLFVLEDCAQCLGGSINGKKVGTFGDMGLFSFQMNKNMTTGEGGCVVTGDERLYRRAFATHDLGYAQDEHGKLIMDDPELSLWGRGYRLDELRGAVLREQLKKLPHTIAAMHRSKYRIRHFLEQFPEVQLRKVIDPEGDTGCFLLTTWRNPVLARRVNQALRAEGIVTYPQGTFNIVMTDWGLHLYYNIASLVRRSSVDAAGFPWRLTENQESTCNYEKGACPVADSLFERTILLPIPSVLTEKDEDDIIQAFGKVLNAIDSLES